MKQNIIEIDTKITIFTLPLDKGLILSSIINYRLYRLPNVVAEMRKSASSG